jgi:signal transduction histidine kinase
VPTRGAGGRIEGVLGVCLDITERRRTEEDNGRLLHDIETTRRRLGLLSKRLIEVQEQERAAIARELHDDIGQVLTSVKIQLSIMLNETAGAGGPHRDICEAVANVDNTIQLVRELSVALRPSTLEHLGLGPTLRWYIAQESARGAFTTHFEMHPPDFQVPLPLATTSFRIVQQAIRQAQKPLGASHVHVHVSRTEHTLELWIKSDINSTVAVDTADDADLLLIRERARVAGGECETHVTPTHSRVTIRLPIK